MGAGLPTGVEKERRYDELGRSGLGWSIFLWKNDIDDDTIASYVMQRGKYMQQVIYFGFVNVKKYIRVDKATGKREVVSVSNRKALPVERHLELLNLNDEGHIYLDCVEDDLDEL